MAPTLWLSCHVHYACRHSGACCRAGWPLPVEERAVAAIDAAVGAGRIATVDGSPLWLRETAEAPEGVAGTFRLVSGACVFHVPRTSGGPDASDRHCAVHAVLGHDALPASCQHFPRVCLVDARGVRVSLSHYCPTAAAMLVDHDGPVRIVPGPPAVPGVDVPEGLDVRDSLPPRLNDRVLMDLDALTAWEAHVVDALAGPRARPGSAETALARLHDLAVRVAGWSPGGAPLVEAVRSLVEANHAATYPPAGAGYGARAGRDALVIAAATCRAPWTWPKPPANLEAVDAGLVAPHWMEASPVVRRYLAARAFGSWQTYQADGALGLIRWLDLVRAVLRAECARAAGAAGRGLDRELLTHAIRQADLLLVHYADSAAIAGALAVS